MTDPTRKWTDGSTVAGKCGTCFFNSNDMDDSKCTGCEHGLDEGEADNYQAMDAQDTCTIRPSGFEER